MSARLPWPGGSSRTGLFRTRPLWRRPCSHGWQWRHAVLVHLLLLLLLFLPAVLWILWTMRMPALLAAGVQTPARNATTAPSTRHAGFPRLLGMNIGEKNYHESGYQRQLARLDIAILGFYRGWSDAETGTMRDVVRNLKLLHPGMLVGQYTVLNEASNDPANTAENDKQATLSQNGWWLRNAAGDQVQWTRRYQAWETNITGWTSPDGRGRRYAEWLAERDFAVFFQPVPEFDIWYVDNVMDHQRIGAADWQGRGHDDAGTDARVSQAFRVGQSRHWQAAHALAPALTVMGNPDNDLSSAEYRGRLQGAFLEGLMGQRWSLYERSGWRDMMARYFTVNDNLAAPRIVGFHVFGHIDDFRLLRFALSSCLMGDGYFSFTDKDRGYSSVAWFDEFDADLGFPIDPPQSQPWQDGIYRRRFQNGMVLVNPDGVAHAVAIDNGYRHLQGEQARQINTGGRTKRVVLPPRDGLLLLKWHD